MFKGFGPSAESPETEFKDKEEVGRTCAQYFAFQAGNNKPGYNLRFPWLPVINVGHKKKPVNWPLEVVELLSGGCKPHKDSRTKSTLTSHIIKHAAKLPDERFKFLESTSEGSLMGSIRGDKNAEKFGLGSNVSQDPIRLSDSMILAPPKLQYGNKLIEPKLGGTPTPTPTPTPRDMEHNERAILRCSSYLAKQSCLWLSIRFDLRSSG